MLQKKSRDGQSRTMFFVAFSPLDPQGRPRSAPGCPKYAPGSAREPKVAQNCFRFDEKWDTTDNKNYTHKSLPLLVFWTCVPRLCYLWGCNPGAEARWRCWPKALGYKYMNTYIYIYINININIYIYIYIYIHIYIYIYIRHRACSLRV